MTRVYVAPISFGLGDLVVSLPAVQALVVQAGRERDEAWLVARSPAQARLAERIDGLSGWVTEEAFDRDRTDGRLVDLRDHPLQRDHWWGSPESEAAIGSLSINDILARICADFAIDADFTRPVPLIAHPRPELRSAVLLVVDSDSPSKCWPVDRWAAVASGIRDFGLDPRVVTRDDTRHAAVAGVDAVCAPTPGDAVDVLTAARAVVGVDTGLTHIAAQQGTPTVTICRAHAVFFRPWPHTRAVTGDECDDACRTVEREYAYNERVDLRDFEWRPRPCPVNGRCLDAVRVDDVVYALEQVLRPT
jgi:hypothetical protein